MPCATRYPCSWDPNTPNSWQTNAAQNATQVFYYVGKFHDHLTAAPIGFTRGGRQLRGRRRRRRAGQARRRQHRRAACRTATTSTTPTWAPRPTAARRPCRCTCSTSPKTDPAQDPFIAANGGDESDVVYHEYTHGLSNRLVVDANGISTLGNVQAGVDGRGLERLVRHGLPGQRGPARRTPTRAGELRVGDYVGGRQGPHPHPAARLPGRRTSATVPRAAGGRTRRLHLRRLRP